MLLPGCNIFNSKSREQIPKSRCKDPEWDGKLSEDVDSDWPSYRDSAVMLRCLVCFTLLRRGILEVSLSDKEFSALVQESIP